MSLQLRRNIYMPQLTMNYVKGASIVTKAEYINDHFTHSAESGKLVWIQCPGVPIGIYCFMDGGKHQNIMVID